MGVSSSRERIHQRRPIRASISTAAGPDGKQAFPPPIAAMDIGLEDATDSGSLTYVRQALAAGADPRNSFPLTIATNRKNIHEERDFVAIIQELLNNGTSSKDRADAIKVAMKQRGSYSPRHDAKKIGNLDRVVLLIQSASQSSCAAVPKLQVAEATVKIWKKLLFSPDYSDVKFCFPTNPSCMHTAVYSPPLAITLIPCFLNVGRNTIRMVYGNATIPKTS